MTDHVQSLREANQSLSIQLATKEHEVSAAYRDRDALLALLVSMYPANRCDVEESWSIITLQLPVGFTEWPIPAEHRDLFWFLEPVSTSELPNWERHSSEERLQVVLDYARANVEGRGDFSPHQPAQEPPQPVQEPLPAPEAPKRRGRPRKTTQTPPKEG